MPRNDSSTQCIREKVMLRIQTTDDVSMIRAQCKNCDFAVHSYDPSQAGYEAAVNHALNENHRVVLTTTFQTEMNIYCSTEENTVDLGPKKKE